MVEVFTKSRLANIFRKHRGGRYKGRRKRRSCGDYDDDGYGYGGKGMGMGWGGKRGYQLLEDDLDMNPFQAAADQLQAAKFKSYFDYKTAAQTELKNQRMVIQKNLLAQIQNNPVAFMKYAGRRVKTRRCNPWSFFGGLYGNQGQAQQQASSEPSVTAGFPTYGGYGNI